MSPEEAEKAFAYFLNSRGISIRLRKDGFNGWETGAGKADLIAEPGRIFENARRFEKPGRIEDIPGYDEGAWVVQDESSMIPAHILAKMLKEADCKDGDKTGVPEILDICAAPGGKILQLADELETAAHYTACDISDQKIRKISDNAARLSIENVDVKVRDALEFYSDDRDRYDAVIADLPCSGLGVIAKKPDIKFNTKPGDLASLLIFQRQMLDNAVQYVKPGGLLAFSTCTINRGECESNVEHILKSSKCLTLADPTDYVPETLRSSIKDGVIKVLPGAYDSDGFFVAVFRKQ